MIAIRILVYEGDVTWVQRVLSKSFSDGIKYTGMGNSIKVVTLGTLPDNVNILFDNPKSTLVSDMPEVDKL
jgi:hypothetical protein